jgi:hypothetical protein
MRERDNFELYEEPNHSVFDYYCFDALSLFSLWGFSRTRCWNIQGDLLCPMI